jgi:hypothetical protein
MPTDNRQAELTWAGLTGEAVLKKAHLAHCCFLVQAGKVDLVNESMTLPILFFLLSGSNVVDSSVLLHNFKFFFLRFISQQDVFLEILAPFLTVSRSIDEHFRSSVVGFNWTSAGGTIQQWILA